MNYFIRMGNKNRGPMDAAAIGALSSAGPDSLVCPGGKDPKNRKNWRLLSSYPELLKAVEAGREARAQGPVHIEEAPLRPVVSPEPEFVPPEEPAHGSSLFLAGATAVCLAVLWLGWRMWGPAKAPTPAAAAGGAPAAEWSGVAKALTLPCGGGTKTVKPQSASAMPNGKLRLTLETDNSDLVTQAVFEYDPKTKEVVAANEAARDILDLKKPCSAR